MHHDDALLGTAAAAATAIVTVIALAVRRRVGHYPRWSLVLMLVTASVAGGTLAWTGLAGGRINHPELQSPGDLEAGSVHEHYH